MPEGVRVLEAAAKKFGFELQPRRFRFRDLRLLRKARPHDAGGLEGTDRQARRHLFRRRRHARPRARPRLALGLADPVPPRIRPVHQSAPGAADAGRALPARQPQAWRHRLLGGAREHRGRIFRHRRQDVPRHRARGGGAGNRHEPHRRRPRLEIRLRARPLDAEEAPHLRDQIERHRHHHAVLGRAREGNGEGLPGREVEPVPHRHSHRAFRDEPRLVQRGGRLQFVRRHPVRPRPRLHRHHRHRAVRQHQSRAQIPLGVRAGARLGARTSTAKASPIRSARSGRAP